jgi:hypothetical protein
MGACQFVHNLAPDARPPPANEAIIAGSVQTKMSGRCLATVSRTGTGRNKAIAPYRLMEGRGAAHEGPQVQQRGRAL